VIAGHVQRGPDDGENLGMVQQLDTDDELAILNGKTFLGINPYCFSCHNGCNHLDKINLHLSKWRKQPHAPPEWMQPTRARSRRPKLESSARGSTRAPNLRMWISS
jgi:hypothetical protein